MPAYEDHLLPLSETALNKALAACSTRIEDIDAPTREVWDPWKCPEPFLKVLAHAYSVDLWDESWNVYDKRRIIANSVALHRLKGTLEGIRRYLSYTAGDLRGVVVRPQQVFSGAGLSREQREVWLRNLPQVRVWRIRDKGDAGLGSYVRVLRAQSFFYPNAAPTRRQRRARWFEGAQETDTRVSEYGTVYRLHKAGEAGRMAAIDRLQGRGFFYPNTARSRLYTVRPQARLPHRNALGPSLRAVKSEPELVKEAGQAYQGSYVTRLQSAAFFLPNRAEDRLYWRFPVVDGKRTPKPRAIEFMGQGRYSWPAHTARLRMAAPGKRPHWEAGAHPLAAKPKFWRPRDTSRVAFVRTALLAARRQSDRIQIEHVGVRRLLAGRATLIAGRDTHIIGKSIG